MQLRTIFKYVPVECKLSDIKKGDVYRIMKRDNEDCVDENLLWVACSDAEPNTQGKSGSVVYANPLVQDPELITPGFPRRVVS